MLLLPPFIRHFGEGLRLAEIRVDLWSRFAARVKDGSITQAIRQRTVRRPQVGDICCCCASSANGPRRSIGNWVCVAVEAIEICECGDGTFTVVIDDVELSIADKQALASREGFHGSGNLGAFTALMRSGIIRDKRPGLLSFSGYVVRWDFLQPVR